MTSGHGLRRVAMFVHALDGRAVSRLSVAVCRELSAMGLEAVILCTARSDDAAIRNADVEIHTVGSPSRPLTLQVPRFARWLRRYRPDVLFAHLNGPARAAIVAREVARVPTRIVVVEHTHYSTFGWNRRSVRDALIRVLYRRADRVGGVSPAVAEDFAARFPGLADKTSVLPAVGPNPDDPALLSLAAPDHPWFREPDARPVICSVGNVVPRKGQDALVEALPLVCEANRSVRLVLVGRFDDESFVAHLRELAMRLGVSDRVSFVGYRPDALAYIAHARVFAHASWTEGCPTVLLEAMACGTPVVATNCPGGASYVLDGGRCGLLVPLGNPAGIASAIVRVLDNGEIRQALVTAGRARARDFAPRAVADAYRTLAEQCLTIH